jgi:hypothetical protein
MPPQAPYAPYQTFESHPHYVPTGGPSRKTSGKAVASLVLGIIGLLACFVILPSLLAVIFGWIGLRGIKRSGGQLKGRGLAIAGLVTGIIGLIAGVGLIVLAASGSLDDWNLDSVDAAGNERRDPNALEVGDCVEVPDGEFVLRVTILDCAEPHGGEVIASDELPEGAYPGDAEIDEQVLLACVEEFKSYTGESLRGSDLDVYYLIPREASWNQGDRMFGCIAFDPSGADLTGSLAN